MTRFGKTAVCLLATVMASPALSATIKSEATGNQNFSAITVAGDLQPGDAKKFVEQVLTVQNGVVILASDGGNLIAGIETGKAIRLKGLATVVPDGARCASACALAWLAGSPRSMGAHAQVGFHAAYRIEGGGSKVSGAGNAVAGAYLNSLGLPDRAIAYIADASPDQMTWLSFEDAGRIGIEVRPFAAADEAQPTSLEQKQAKTEAIEPLNSPSSGVQKDGPALAVGWSRYRNERFGTSSDVPVYLFKFTEPPPANGDGRGFKSEDGAELRIYGSYGPYTVTDTFADYKAWLLQNTRLTRITYKAEGRNWLVVSGTEGDNIVYRRQ